MHKNTDESCVGPYTLPDVLKCSGGRMIDNAFDWVNIRRSEILDIYRRTMYGFLPPRPDKTEFEVILLARGKPC